MLSYYCTLLFLLKKFNECENFINHWVEFLFQENDTLGVSNLLRLLACIKISERDLNSTYKILENLTHIFKIIECQIGDAVTGYSLGQMMFLSNKNGIAREKLKKALESYQCLDHVFGQYYCLITLLKIETKMNNKSQVNVYHDMMKEVNKKKKGKHSLQSKEFSNFKKF